ncbi:hypothetical protein [Okeania sp. KiyG1]|uniref:hypothetical protein n=1 Tax=Okeania sp. KiyG1 TaxID=2720165 RepID=UPI0019AFD388|nr:hypothetical protein [Okeania sp. KiyG1]GGA25691.1 hypothetical protein CYANOKiyG1_41530 [Okeania sp. KiyG1]
MNSKVKSQKSKVIIYRTHLVSFIEIQKLQENRFKGKHSAISGQLSAIKMNEASICLTSTTFLNKELKHKNSKLKLSTKGNKADS